MLHLRYARQRAQIAILMPLAVIACIGVLGLVLDIGTFRLIDSEFDKAADAAALAAAWYDPVCPNNPNPPPPDEPAPDLRCARADNAPGSAFIKANNVAIANLGPVSKLCENTPEIQVNTDVLTQSPRARAVSVIIKCNAPFLAGAVLGLHGGSEITRWATAGLGDEQANGALGDYKPFVEGSSPRLIDGLVPL